MMPIARCLRWMERSRRERSLEDDRYHQAADIAGLYENIESMEEEER